MPEAAVGVPPALTRRGNRVLRPRDAAHVYSHPRPELARLVRRGALLRLASGYYALTPQHRLGDVTWRPSVNAVGLGIAQADYGADAVALMGVGAARHHGAIPRALALTVVAVPKQRPDLETSAGRIIFVRRVVGRLDLERLQTELVTGWVTTVEQTLLDFAARPELGGLPQQAWEETVRSLWRRCDQDRLADLAREQRRSATLRRTLKMIEVT